MVLSVGNKHIALPVPKDGPWTVITIFMETMDRSKLEHFAATSSKGYVEIVLDDGSILVGKNFGYFIKGQKLDLWGIRQDDGVTSVISGLCIKKIRGI